MLSEVTKKLHDTVEDKKKVLRNNRQNLLNHLIGTVKNKIKQTRIKGTN